MILVIHIWISAWIIYFFTIQATKKYIAATYLVGMVKGLRRRTGVCGGTYVAQPHCHHLRANTSTCTFLHQALYSLSMLFTAFLCPLLLRTWEPPQRHYWGDLPATFHFLRWRQHFWNPPIKVADNVTWPDNVASAQVTSSRALPIWDFDRPTKRGGGDTWVFWFLGNLPSN